MSKEVTETMRDLAEWFRKNGGWKSGDMVSRVINKVLDGQTPEQAKKEALEEMFGKRR